MIRVLMVPTCTCFVRGGVSVHLDLKGHRKDSDIAIAVPIDLNLFCGTCGATYTHVAAGTSSALGGDRPVRSPEN